MIQRFTGKKAVWEHQSQTAFLLSERRSDQNPQIVPVDLIKLFQGERIGAASYLDLRDSEVALLESELSYYQSIYNYLVAESELQLLLGTANVAAE